MIGVTVCLCVCAVSSVCLYFCVIFVCLLRTHRRRRSCIRHVARHIALGKFPVRGNWRLLKQHTTYLCSPGSRPREACMHAVAMLFMPMALNSLDMHTLPHGSPIWGNWRNLKHRHTAYFSQGHAHEKCMHACRIVNGIEFLGYGD